MRNPVRSTASELDQASSLLHRTAMITPCEVAADQGISLLQQPYHDTNRIPKKAAVARIMHERSRDCAVETDDLAEFDLLLPRTRKNGAIDRFPGLSPDGADRVVQHRLFRRPRQWQPCEGTERGGIFEMKRQLLIAQLTVLLEQPAAKHR